jgi:dipeptidyl-peptidase-4
MPRTTRLSDEEIARLPPPGLAIPSDFQFSPDGTHLAFLWSEDSSRKSSLWVTRIADGATTCAISADTGFQSDKQMSKEALMERERKRQLRSGVWSFAWSGRGATLIVPAPGRLIARDVHSGQERVLLESPTFSNARLSPDGKRVAYTDQRELWCADIDAGADVKPRQLTHSQSATAFSGIPEFVAQEELGRHDAFWWHPSSQQLMFVEADEAPVVTTMLRDPHDGTSAPYRYPFAGTPNATWRVGVVDVVSGATDFIDLGAHKREYLATAQYDSKGRILLQTLSRDQQELLLIAIDQPGAVPNVLLTEHITPWINLHGKLRALPDGSFLRVTDRSGITRIERRDAAGHELGFIAAPAGGVRRLVAVDFLHNKLLFMGVADDPRQQHLFAAALDCSGEAKQLSVESGWHEAFANDTGALAVRMHHSLQSLPRTWLEHADHSVICHLPSDKRESVVQVEAPEEIELTAGDGQPMYGLFYRPSAEFQPPYPLAVSVYGGPHHQAVRNAWDLTVDMRAQRLARHGIAVLKIDNRGAGGRNMAFESSLYRSFGQREVEDQVRGVKHLVAERLVDPTRVAIYGWSYGGYMSARCLFKAGDVFKAAVVGAPVVRWQVYDTAYTERYMGLIENDEDRAIYDEASLLSSIPDKPGALLLLHGLCDENVLFDHTAALLEALNRKKHRYELVVFPDERHGVRLRPNRTYLETRICEFLIEQLLVEQHGAAC